LDEKPRPPSPFEESKPSAEDLEARWRMAMEAVTEAPRSPEVLLHAAGLAEQMGRKTEAYAYYHKAITLDPTKAFLIPKLRQNAVTPEQQQEATKIAKRPASFARALDDVFAYPFRGGGIGILILGAVFVYGCRLLFQYNTLIPFVSFLAGGLITAYLSMFYVDVCTSTATGSEDLPEWPDPVRFREFLLDWSKLATASFVSFLPVIAAFALLTVYVIQNLPAKQAEPPPAYSTYFVDSKGFITPTPAAKRVPAPVAAPQASVEDLIPPGVRAALALIVVAGGFVSLLGLAYLPMATLVNCVYGHPFACFNPVFILRSMFAAPKNYAICVLGYFGTAFLVGVLEAVAALPKVFLFTGVAIVMLEIYGLTVQMRILGVFYRMNQSKLRWMSD
jgi:hypothetical protein